MAIWQPLVDWNPSLLITHPSTPKPKGSKENTKNHMSLCLFQNQIKHWKTNTLSYKETCDLSVVPLFFLVVGEVPPMFENVGLPKQFLQVGTRWSCKFVTSGRRQKPMRWNQIESTKFVGLKKCNNLQLVLKISASDQWMAESQLLDFMEINHTILLPIWYPPGN